MRLAVLVPHEVVTQRLRATMFPHGRGPAKRGEEPETAMNDAVTMIEAELRAPLLEWMDGRDSVWNTEGYAGPKRSTSMIQCCARNEDWIAMLVSGPDADLVELKMRWNDEYEIVAEEERPAPEPARWPAIHFNPKGK